MKKYLFLVLPLLAMLFMSCNNEVSYESINASYDTPADGLIPAEGGEITIKVASTHSFKLSSQSSAFSFYEDGIVNYKPDGVAVVESTHKVDVASNETGADRQLFIVATHLRNPAMESSLIFLQPAMESNQ